MHRLETVARVRQGTPDNDAHGIVEIRTTHLVFEADGQGFFGESFHLLSAVDATSAGNVVVLIKPPDSSTPATRSDAPPSALPGRSQESQTVRSGTAFAPVTLPFVQAFVRRTVVAG
jgi:hypothetical protein